jgi:MerR family transcriptional regulator, light-induced transcriptional regulator
MPTAPSESSTARFRSGTAARMAGLPVTTLRVWERRYGVAAATKSEGGQRMYSAHDVSRLKLLRQLTGAGHAIGTIATLTLDTLRDLGAPGPEVAAAERRAVVIGRGIARALRAVQGLSLGAVHDDLDAAEAPSAEAQPADLLVARLASLQPASVERVLALAAGLGAAAVVVVYAFGTDSAAEALRAAGAAVQREPIGNDEFVRLVQAAAVRPVVATAAAPIAPRRFNDATLAAIAELPSPVACECLRHMAEIVGQLAGFERYSRECISTSPPDAALHRELNRVAGSARSMFEASLQRVLDAEGLRPAPGSAEG